MFSDEGNWGRAYTDFYAAFTHYQEIGARDKAKQNLRYVVIANMLSGSEQNPFDAREAKVYEREPDIAALVQLRAAYEKIDVKIFYANLEEIGRHDDVFVKTHLQKMVADFQCRAIGLCVRPYTRVLFSFLSSLLRQDEKEVEKIVARMIGRGELDGRINASQPLRKVLELRTNSGGGPGSRRKFIALENWTKALAQANEQLQSHALGASSSHQMDFHAMF